MKNLSIMFIGCLLTSQLTMAQTFMTEEEMMNTFPGATISGISNEDGKTRWTQIYSQASEGEMQGEIEGDWAGDPYESKWFVKQGKWCENWGSGNGCWDVELVDGNKLRIYDKGTALENMWEIL